MYWWLDFHTVLRAERHWRRFFSTFWRVSIPEEIGLAGPAIVSHAEYNHPTDKAKLLWDVAYLNTLSSLNGAIRHQLQDILGWHEYSAYEESILLVRAMTYWSSWGCMSKNNRKVGHRASTWRDSFFEYPGIEQGSNRTREILSESWWGSCRKGEDSSCRLLWMRIFVWWYLISNTRLILLPVFTNN